MAKYYVIPVDSDGLGYFGVKERLSPYTHSSWFCGGCPQAFGGNDQGGIPETLYREALEESHMKISMALGVRYYRKVHEHADMTFWVGAKFAYDPGALMPDFLRRRNASYAETTGLVFKVDMAEVPITTRQVAAGSVLQTYFRRTGSRPEAEHIAQFLASEMAEAIRSAAQLVQAGGLPSSLG